eukprot:GHVU01212257.1.p1 GENE.GHVU01212257.1~~GHVU01212257.1.p1  ORF type:complete len:387 (+),score=40.43 GHVU01212257.1:2454-3614(+)
MSYLCRAESAQPAYCYTHVRRNARRDHGLRNKRRMPQALTLVDLLHRCRTSAQFDAIGKVTVRIIETWEESAFLQWFQDIVLDKYRHFHYTVTGVPGTLPSNNNVESYNESVKAHTWTTGLKAATVCVIRSAIHQLAFNDSRDLGGHLPITRNPLRYMPQQLQEAADMLLIENKQYYYKRDAEYRVDYFFDSPYDKAIGRRQRGRNKKIQGAEVSISQRRQVPAPFITDAESIGAPTVAVFTIAAAEAHVWTHQGYLVATTTGLLCCAANAIVIPAPGIRLLTPADPVLRATAEAVLIRTVAAFICAAGGLLIRAARTDRPTTAVLNTAQRVQGGACGCRRSARDQHDAAIATATCCRSRGADSCGCYVGGDCCGRWLPAAGGGRC